MLDVSPVSIEQISKFGCTRDKNHINLVRIYLFLWDIATIKSALKARLNEIPGCVRVKTNIDGRSIFSASPDKKVLLFEISNSDVV